MHWSLHAILICCGRCFLMGEAAQLDERCPPSTKRKIAPAKAQQLINARAKKQLAMTSKQLAGQLLEIAEIRNPLPEHMRLLELCQLGATQGLSTRALTDCGGFRFELVQDARQLFAADFLKKPGFSQDEIDLHVSECFKRFYSFAKKPGRKALPPIFMVQLTLHIKHKIYVERNFDCTTEMEIFWATVVLEYAKTIGY
jgi:hypothetical protein